MVTVTIDGNQYEAEKGQTILEVCRANGIAIPTLCDHRSLEPYGACRLCTVEWKGEGWSTITTSCTLPVRDGMTIETGSDEVMKSRKMIIELLLARCPEEAVLKNLAEQYGVGEVRFKKKDDNCILCGLCARMCERMGSEAISFENRGNNREIKSPFDENSPVCLSCGACFHVCPTTSIDKKRVEGFKGKSVQESKHEYEFGMVNRANVYFNSLQDVPKVPSIDVENCVHLVTGGCGLCEEVCEVDAIDYKQEDSEEEINVGAVVVATGYQQYDLSGSELNYDHPDVITGLELERMLSPSGPTGGHVKVPSSGKVPKSVTFILCSGSRDERTNEYCSRICCTYSLKNANLIMQEHPDTEVNICYIDIRAAGRNYEEYYQKVRGMGVNFIHGRPSEVFASREGGLEMDVYDHNTSKLLQLQSELVVLAAAMRPNQGTTDMISRIHMVFGPDGFIKPMHVKIGPVDTTMGGVYIAGTASGPKAIQECITDAGAAASRVATFLKDPTTEIDLNKAIINADLCIKCGTCSDGCVYDAIDTTGEFYKVIEVACEGCGKCAANCPSGAIDLRQFLDQQIEAQIDGIMEGEDDTIVAIVCTQCGYNAADIAGTARMDYPSNVKIVRYPCTARVSHQHMIYPLLKGAKGVMVVGCLPDQCHYIDGNFGAADRADQAKQLLDLIGIGSVRLEFFNMSSAEGASFAAAANRMVDQCK